MSSPARHRARLLVYSQDGLGLGHLRRTTLLASEFLGLRPGASALTISDSPVGQFFTMAPGHDYLKLPSVRKVRPGVWSPITLPMPFQQVLEMRKDVIRSTALAYDPDILLVDHMPHGAMGELVPALEGLRPGRTRVVLGLRDILDAPDTIRRRWEVEGAFDALRSYYDDVLVYGSRDVFDIGREYAWPDDLAPRLHYCGYVSWSQQRPAASVRHLRRRYLAGHPRGDLIVAMAGGGADGQRLFTTLLEALPAVGAERDCVLVVVTGPFLPGDCRATIERLAQDLPVHLLTTVSDPIGHMAAADLVVSMAGYNTTAELLRHSERALLVPRSGPSAEQQMRAGRFAERGWVRWLRPGDLSATTLARAVLDALSAPKSEPATAPDLRGTERAIAQLLSHADHVGEADGAGLEPSVSGSAGVLVAPQSSAR